MTKRSRGVSMRALTLAPFLLGGLGGALLVASCDSGGEPPEGPDTGFPDAPGVDTRIDTRRPSFDGESPDTSLTDGPGGDGPCGTQDNACCTGEAEPCMTKGTSCKSGFCRAPCGDPGQECCKDDKCKGVDTVCRADKHVCVQCGDPGDLCCGLNTCASGGCCIGEYCSSEGTKCPDTDGGVCMSGGCGTCGSPGQPCCNDSCTAPRTICEGAIAAVDAGEGGGGMAGSSGECAACGGPGQPCCVGSTCEDEFECHSEVCVCKTSTCGEPDAGGD